MISSSGAYDTDRNDNQPQRERAHSTAADFIYLFHAPDVMVSKPPTNRCPIPILQSCVPLEVSWEIETLTTGMPSTRVHVLLLLAPGFPLSWGRGVGTTIEVLSHRGNGRRIDTSSRHHGFGRRVTLPWSGPRDVVAIEKDYIRVALHQALAESFARC